MDAVEYVHMAITTLKRLLFEREIVAKEFARECGISEGSLNQLVNGKRTPTLEVAYKIARQLDLPVAAVFPWDEVVKEDGE